MDRTQILFATSNPNKLREVREILGERYEVLSLEDIHFTEDIPEPFDTIEENSIFKANYFYEKKNIACMAEDSGLEVDALNGRPSAYSARYAGEEKNDRKNLEKLLDEMKGISERNAQFVSVLTYRQRDSIHSFRGEMRGAISESPRGENGFGYDPIFIAERMNRTNAELTPEEKNKISHRKKALAQWIEFLQEKKC